MVSGIILSREVFAFLPLEGGLGFAEDSPHGIGLLGIYTDECSSGAALGDGDERSEKGGGDIIRLEGAQSDRQGSCAGSLLFRRVRLDTQQHS